MKVSLPQRAIRGSARYLLQIVPDRVSVAVLGSRPGATSVTDSPCGPIIARNSTLAVACLQVPRSRRGVGGPVACLRLIARRSQVQIITS
jgi:hypothetical protein